MVAVSFTIMIESDHDLSYDWTPMCIYTARRTMNLIILVFLQSEQNNRRPLMMTTWHFQYYCILILSPERKKMSSRETTHNPNHKGTGELQPGSSECATVAQGGENITAWSVSQLPEHPFEPVGRSSVPKLHKLNNTALRWSLAENCPSNRGGGQQFQATPLIWTETGSDIEAPRNSIANGKRTKMKCTPQLWPLEPCEP